MPHFKKTRTVPNIADLPPAIVAKLEDAKKKLGTIPGKEFAVIELAIWDEVLPFLSQPVYRVPFMAEWLGCTHNDVATRHAFMLLGDIANSFWEQIDNGSMTFLTAARLLREMKAASKENKISLDEAITSGLAKYASLNIAYFSNGKVVHRKLPTDLPPIDTILKRGRGRPRKEDGMINGGHAFWDSIRDQFAAYIAPKLEGLGLAERDDAYASFGIAVKSFCDEWTTKISRMANAERQEYVISRNQLLDACKKLAYTPPKKIDEPINMSVIKRIRNTLIHKFHPDKNIGCSPEMCKRTKQRYEAVMAAYDIIERYAEQQRR